MNEKAQAWLGNLLGWGQRRQAADAETLYAETVRLARNPVFFDTYGVADDVDGRFDALSLIVALVMRKLKTLDDDGKALSQQLFDSMFADMDLSLREMDPLGNGLVDYLFALIKEIDNLPKDKVLAGKLDIK